MTVARHQVIGAGLWAIRATGLHRIATPLTQGLGAILTFHRVRAWPGDRFAPNRLLEITPAFLDSLLGHVRREGYRIVPMDDVPDLLRGRAQPRWLALTFDDGYRDTLTEALPVLERHGAPFTVYATTGFLERTARLWWVELEVSLRILKAAHVDLQGRRRMFRTETAREKDAAFQAIRSGLLAGSDDALLAASADLCGQAGLAPDALVDDLCLDWGGLANLAAHPLATVGCHTVTHPRLALASQSALHDELASSRTALEARLGRPVRHFCYPYGMASAAGRREYEMASALGFATAVTTRPGLLHADSAARPTALPRVSVNGLWQSTGALDVLLSGVGFAVWNGGRRAGTA